jgi:hypothetical protein
MTKTYQQQQIELSSEPPKTGGIMWHIENSAKRVFVAVFNVVSTPIRNLLALALEQFMDVLEDGFISLSTPIVNQVLANKAVPDFVKASIRDAMKKEHAAALAMIIPIALGVLIAIPFALADPFKRLIIYEVEHEARSARPSGEDIYRMMWRQAFDEGKASQFANDIGYHDDIAQGYKALARERAPMGAWLAGWLRNFPAMGDIDMEFNARGYPPEDRMLLKELAHIIPPVQDLIRMAVREAWRDDVANRFGYDDDYPEQAGLWGEKLGLSAEWMRRYWRAHWELPSPAMGYEMLHRRIINPDELELLLRVLDIPTFWRERLRKLSYNPYTRVDTRRMFSTGALTEDEVYDNYRDLGYDDEHATKMTDWTIKEYAATEDDLTKAEILGAWLDGVINETDARTFLNVLGLTDQRIEILIAREKLKIERKYNQEYVENVRLLFIGDLIDTTGVYDRLGKINLPPGTIEDRLAIWRLQKERAITKPTKAEIANFATSGVISPDLAIELLRRIRVPEDLIPLYIALWYAEE